MMTKPLLLAAAIVAVTLAISGTASAAPSVLGVTTPAGYIPMVKALNQVCEAPGVKIEGHLGGNTGQQIAQIEAGSGVSVVVTDAETLKSIKSKVTYTKTMTLGGTPMVLVWKKGLNLKGPEDLTDASVTRIAVADPKAAIYGRTAAQWLSGQKPEVKKALEPKWLAVRNLPQAMSYVVRGEADAAFVNVLAAKKNERKLGGSVKVTSGYEPITMTASIVKGSPNEKAADQYLNCLGTPKAKAVLKQFGVGNDV